jgi:hypothetical protein
VRLPLPVRDGRVLVARHRPRCDGEHARAVCSRWWRCICWGLLAESIR